MSIFSVEDFRTNFASYSDARLSVADCPGKNSSAAIVAVMTIVAVSSATAVSAAFRVTVVAREAVSSTTPGTPVLSDATGVTVTERLDTSDRIPVSEA